MAEAKLKIVPKENLPLEKQRTPFAKIIPTIKENHIPYFVLILVTMNILMLSFMFYTQSKMWGQVMELSLRAKRIAAASEKREKVEQKKKEKDRTEAEGIEGTLFQMDEFLINISAEKGPKYLQARMELELSDPGLEDEVTRIKPEMRDSIIVLFSSWSYRDLLDANQMKKLRTQLLTTMNNMLKTGKIKQIYFTKFQFN